MGCDPRMPRMGWRTHAQMLLVGITLSLFAGMSVICMDGLVHGGYSTVCTTYLPHVLVLIAGVWFISFEALVFGMTSIGNRIHLSNK